MALDNEMLICSPLRVTRVSGASRSTSNAPCPFSHVKIKRLPLSAMVPPSQLPWTDLMCTWIHTFSLRTLGSSLRTGFLSLTCRSDHAARMLTIVARGYVTFPSFLFAKPVGDDKPPLKDPGLPRLRGLLLRCDTGMNKHMVRVKSQHVNYPRAHVYFSTLNFHRQVLSIMRRTGCTLVQVSPAQLEAVRRGEGLLVRS